jgi:hypothetical protein
VFNDRARDIAPIAIVVCLLDFRPRVFCTTEYKCTTADSGRFNFFFVFGLLDIQPLGKLFKLGLFSIATFSGVLFIRELTANESIKFVSWNVRNFQPIRLCFVVSPLAEFFNISKFDKPRPGALRYQTSLLLGLS